MNNIIELKSVDNSSLHFNFKEKLKNAICYFNFLLFFIWLKIRKLTTLGKVKIA